MNPERKPGEEPEVVPGRVYEEIDLLSASYVPGGAEVAFVPRLVRWTCGCGEIMRANSDDALVEVVNKHRLVCPLKE